MKLILIGAQNCDGMMETIDDHDLSTRVGLEIHCQLTALQSKLFCSCPSNYREKEPNTNICPVCCGLPGTLPLLNKSALELASMISLALHCQIPENIVFYRKNYFYPDLPKNFQLTQYNIYGITSIGVEGRLNYGKKSARIRRIQLEEDPGRLIYEINGISTSGSYTLIDYNRAGIALVEVVTEPDFSDPKDVRIFLNKFTSIIEHLGVCNTRLEGAVRCDANVSIQGGKRVEIKNVGSFKDVEKALNYEIARQKTMSMHEIKIQAETRHWDEMRKVTKQARTKEEEQDYRYFPEPDIPTILIGKEYTSTLNAKMPELPDERKERFISSYELSEHTAQVLIDNKELADFFESTVKIYSSPKEIANWIVTELLRFTDDDLLMESKVYSSKARASLFTGLKIEAKHIAELAKLVDDKTVNRNAAKMILIQIAKTGEMPSEVLARTNLLRTEDKSVISQAVDSVFRAEKSALRDAKNNPNVANFLLGKVMKLTKGRADPKIALHVIKTKLDGLS
jgi:aspartyl-tRNA(Asn)/glutamyl-tRNA(Gln) amidotransferase subunit B